MASNTQRTLAHLKAEGYRCGMVERWCSFTHKRYDLFGFLDIIALDPDNGRTIGVQSFGADFQPHYSKITADKREDAIIWLLSGNALLLVGWRKLKRKNKDGSWSKCGYWTPRLYWMTLDDFYPCPENPPV